MKNPPSLKRIFLSSIGQNAGKTTISIGLYRAMRDAGLRMAFMKPVGQQYVNVGDLSVDKDSYLIGEVYRQSNKLKDMSPVTIGRGYTEKYILNPHRTRIETKILNAFRKLAKGKNAMIIEGTGHAGVGSIIDHSNADVARLLGAKTIIISEGGIGRSIDEIILNKALFDLKGVEVLGVIVNKVLPEKYQKIKKILGAGLRQKGIKLLGVIPLDPLMISPTVAQIRDNLNLQVICGRENLNRRVHHNIVAAMEPHNMVHYLNISGGTLVITSGDRVDNILLAVSSHLVSNKREALISGIILTGGLRPNPKIISLLKKSRMPVLITEDDTYSVAGKIEHLICKIQKTDKDKIQEANRLVKKYVDVKAILKSFDAKK